MPRPRPSPAFPAALLAVGLASLPLFAVEPPSSDADALRQAGLTPTDAPRLVRYLRQRTLSDLDQTRIVEIIKAFGADDFDDRQKASEEAETYGPAAIGPLQKASTDADPEVAYRAKESLRRMDKIQHKFVAAAAVRALVKLRPPETASVLLGFLPMADTEGVADDIRTALVAVAVRGGKTDPALVAAVDDPIAARRSAAYVGLVTGGASDALPRVRDAVRKEADVEARFQGLWSLVLSAKDKEAVPALIGAIPQLSRGRVWQVEDLLLQLSGKGGPGVRFGKGVEGLTKARDGWLGWWASAGPGYDLAAFDYAPRVRGFTDLVEHDRTGYGRGRVASLGPEGKERWSIAGLSNPADARVLPNGRVLVAELNASPKNKVSEREPSGRVTAEREMDQPLAVEPLPGGGVLVACRGEVRELDKDGVMVFSHTRPNMANDIVAARRLPGGDTLFLTSTFPNNCYRIDAKGKEVGKPLQLGRVAPYFAGLDVLPDDKILVTEFNKVTEFDLKTGKPGWTFPAVKPTSVQRLPNGNTLVVMDAKKVVEVDEKGEVVWEHQSKDGLTVLRAYRR